MKIRIIITLILSGCFLSHLQAQWAVIDPTNLAQGIINTTKQIAETSATAKNTLKGFEESVKIFEQGKKYYDALKSVNNLVKDARKVQECVLMVSDISEIYISNFQRMLGDSNFSASELEVIANGYTILLRESNNCLDDLKTIINPSTLSMNDKERMDLIESCHSSLRKHKALMTYYTNKNLGVSYVRAKKKGQLKDMIELYNNPSNRYW